MNTQMEHMKNQKTSMNYIDCLKKWDKALKDAMIDYEYIVIKDHRKFKPKDGLLSISDLVRKPCYLEFKEFDMRFGVDFIKDFTSRLSSKTGIRIDNITFYRTTGRMTHYYFY